MRSPSALVPHAFCEGVFSGEGSYCKPVLTLTI